MCLLDRWEAATDLDSTHIGSELHRVIKLLLKVLLVLQEKHLPLLRHIGLTNLLVTHLAKLLCVLQEVVNLEAVFLGQERHQMLESLDLPVVIHELDELLEHIFLFLLDHFLRAEEGHNAIFLCWDLWVFIEVIYS